MTNRIPVLIIALILFSGCTKFLEFEGEKAEPRLVVNGVIYPDSAFQVELSNSLGFIDIGQIQTLSNGRVAVYDANGNLIDSLLHQGEGIYRSNATTAQQGMRYEVRAAAGAFTEVQASDLVPVAVPILAWDTLRTASSDGFSESENLNFTFTISDPAAEMNYYLIEAFQVQRYFINEIFNPSTGLIEFDTIFIENPFLSRLYMNSSDQVITSENDLFVGDLAVYGSELYFSDALFNGNTREFSVNIEFFNPYGTVIMRLTSCSHDFFRYRRTLQRYDWVEGDPFAEPVQVFSNIEGGGLGIWGAASFDEVDIDF